MEEMVVFEKFEELIDERTLEISIESDFSSLDGKETIVGWKALNMTENSLVIQLEIENRDLISIFEDPDRLVVK